MTLVLTVVSREFTMQVSDRLVSEQRGALITPRWGARNKSIVYLARDACVSISYSGLAMLDGISTDDWMARVITGVGDWNGDVIPAIRERPVPQCRDLGGLVTILQRELNAAFSRVSPALRRIPHTATISGWQWPRRGGRARPSHWLIHKPASESTFQLRNNLGHHWYGDFLLTTVPFVTPFSDTEMSALVDAVRPALGSPEVLEAILVGAIREAADRFRGIGKNCMSIRIRPPAATVRFVPDPAAAAPRPFPAPFDAPHLQTTMFLGPAPLGDTSPTAPSNAAYWPWIILRDQMVVSHALALGSTTDPWRFSLEDFEVLASTVASEPSTP
jgi:hypothetical protein